MGFPYFGLKINSYPEEAKELVGIWDGYAKSSLCEVGISFVTFVNKRPKNPKTNNRRIAGLNAESISYLKDDKELIKMSVENFILLMVKCGVEIDFKEVKGAGLK